MRADAPGAALAAALEAELPGAVALRRALHREPRLSGDEADTRDAVAAALGRALEPVAGTGGMVRLGDPDVPAVAVRAELDALPVIEATGLEFAATGAVSHVCGHDVHVAGLVALVRAVERAGPGALAVPLLAVFQPREEAAPSGAADVAASAAFAAHQPRAMLGIHVQPELPRGTLSVRPGPVNASADQVEIVVRGRAGHGGYPHRTRDPVLALAAVVVAAQQVVSRRTDPLRAAVVTIGQLDAGTASNVVPEHAIARGSVRALEAERDAVLDALREVVEHTAAAHGCVGELAVTPNEPAVVNDEALAAVVAAGVDPAVLDTGFRSCGADDFAHYGAVLPSVMMFLGTAEPGAAPGSEPGLHHPAFAPDDGCVGAVARSLLTAVTSVAAHLSEPHSTESVRAFPGPGPGTHARGGSRE